MHVWVLYGYSRDRINHSQTRFSEKLFHFKARHFPDCRVRFIWAEQQREKEEKSHTLDRKTRVGNTVYVTFLYLMDPRAAGKTYISVVDLMKKNENEGPTYRQKKTKEVQKRGQTGGMRGYRETSKL